MAQLLSTTAKSGAQQPSGSLPHFFWMDLLAGEKKPVVTGFYIKGSPQ
ncbi:MAG: hypothetical protein HRU20_19315 [Pseudomonadales bacterium]|nr:hypothetical protein [Pseudomonadales bacterium]